jgi:hypothetical protein
MSDFPRLNLFPTSKQALKDLQAVTGKSYLALVDMALLQLKQEVNNNKNREVLDVHKEPKISR